MDTRDLGLDRDAGRPRSPPSAPTCWWARRTVARWPSRCFRARRVAPRSVLLAPAALRLGIHDPLPGDVTVTVAHGVDDDIVPPAHSRALVEGTSPARVKLVEVADGHRLQSLVDTGAWPRSSRRRMRAPAPFPHGARLRIDDTPLAEPFCTCRA